MAAIASETCAHHTLPVHEVVLLLETDPHRGLSAAQVDERLARYGPNTLPPPRGSGLLVRILRQFHHPLIYVLLAAAVITAALHEFVDSAVILGVVIINAMVGFLQESRAEAALQSLREVALPAATQVADRLNMAYSGTLVTAGSGAGVVVATGAETEIGQIQSSASPPP